MPKQTGQFRGECMPARAVIFDLDGTLVDTAPDLMNATNHVLSSMGRRAISMEEVRCFVGHGARALIGKGLAATGGLPEGFDIEPAYAEFVRFYSDNIAGGSTVFPGLLALLDRLAAEGIALGICTNKLEGLSVRLIEALGMSHYFGAIVGPDTIGIAKPDPRPYLEAVRRLGIRPNLSMMVGDSETDILTARAAGVPVLAVPFGYTPRPVSEFGPDALISHFDEGWEAIARLLPANP
jgi:phosphoglycolate phosphatase